MCNKDVAFCKQPFPIFILKNCISACSNSSRPDSQTLPGRADNVMWAADRKEVAQIKMKRNSLVQNAVQSHVEDSRAHLQAYSGSGSEKGFQSFFRKPAASGRSSFKSVKSFHSSFKDSIDISDKNEGQSSDISDKKEGQYSSAKSVESVSFNDSSRGKAAKNSSKNQTFG